MMPDLQAGVIRVLAFQALENGTMTFTADWDIEAPTSSGWNCDMAFVLRNAPVDVWLARAAGRPDPEQIPRPSGGSGANGGGGGGGGSQVILGEVRSPGGGGSFGSRTQVGMHRDLVAGEWVLYGGGLAGFDPASADADSFWKVNADFTGQMRQIELPSAPLWCGSLRDLPEIELAYSLPILGSKQTGGHIEVNSPYGTTAFVQVNPFGSGTGTASLAIGNNTADLNALADNLEWAHDGPNKVVVDVVDWEDGQGPFLVLAGIPWPFADEV